MALRCAVIQWANIQSISSPCILAGQMRPSLQQKSPVADPAHFVTISVSLCHDYFVNNQPILNIAQSFVKNSSNHILAYLRSCVVHQ